MHGICISVDVELFGNNGDVIVAGRQLTAGESPYTRNTFLSAITNTSAAGSLSIV